MTTTPDQHLTELTLLTNDVAARGAELVAAREADHVVAAQFLERVVALVRPALQHAAPLHGIWVAGSRDIGDSLYLRHDGTFALRHWAPSGAPGSSVESMTIAQVVRRFEVSQILLHLSSTLLETAVELRDDEAAELRARTAKLRALIALL